MCLLLFSQINGLRVSEFNRLQVQNLSLLYISELLFVEIYLLFPFHRRLFVSSNLRDWCFCTKFGDQNLLADYDRCSITNENM